MKSIQIPKGFIKSDFQLNFVHWKNLEIFEKHILRILWRDFVVYYSKEKVRNSDTTAITFYIRKQDELQIVYHLGIYYNAMFNVEGKQDVVNSDHAVPKDFLKHICLKRK